MREALRQLKEWRDLVQAAFTFRLSINVSGRQLADGRFVPDLCDQLRIHQLDPHLISCELTETALTGESPEVEAAVAAMRTAGVGIALDDFGTGYASLRYVRRFDFDTLKLDRSFVAGLGEDADDTAVVAAAIAMGKALNMTVVAEGVETREQARRLESMGCNLAQGFLFARPMTADALRRLLAGDRMCAPLLNVPVPRELGDAGARHGHA
jgi:EAL domain-containing protein (putative c-di-GMP-specific phosphodiesterase class I)